MLTRILIMKNITRSLLLLILVAVCAFSQATTTSTTTSASISAADTLVCLASGTGVNLPSASQTPTYLGIESEALQVTSNPSTLCYKVKRGQLGTAQASHASGALVWIGNPATSTGDSSRPFSGGAFVPSRPYGSCVSTAQYTLPIIVYGTQSGLQNGNVYTCTAGGSWGQISMFYVSPSNCTFAPTTLTSTNTYIQVGASTLFVLNGTSNAAAGTNTLTCDIMIPTNVTTSTGATILDITLFVGSQTTAPTSLGTATLGSITFPAAATTETASTVTPVTVGGTVTTVSPTAITTVTTAGSFLTIKHTFSTAVKLSTDLQILRYTMPFLQSAAAAMTLNTPGLLVHYTASPVVN